MNLKEAKKILNDNGYKVELNEDLRKAWDEVKDSVGDAIVGGMRKLSPKVQQFIQDTIPLGAALKEAGTIYGFRVEKEEGFYKLTVRNKHTSTAPDFLHIKGFRGNIEVNIDGEGWTTKTIHVHSKKELMDLLETVLYSADWEQPEAAAKGWFKMPQNESTITEAYDDDYKDDLGDVVNIINKKHEVLGTKEVPAEEGYKSYKIVTKDNKFYTLEFKNRFFEYRGRLYPWRLTQSTSKFGFVVLGYNLRQLNDYFNKVK